MVGYIPSVMTVYDWLEPVQIQTYHTSAIMWTSNTVNAARNRLLVGRVAALCQQPSCRLCDASAYLRAEAQRALLHGPRDWKHLNRAGNEALAQAFTACSVVPANGWPER